MHTNYSKEQLHHNLLLKCQACAHGGQDIIPDCLDFDPTKQCAYFNDINDDDPSKPDYDCGAYMHINDYIELNII